MRNENKMQNKMQNKMHDEMKTLQTRPDAFADDGSAPYPGGNRFAFFVMLKLLGSLVSHRKKPGVAFKTDGSVQSAPDGHCLQKKAASSKLVSETLRFDNDNNFKP
jgi:hypothetical protein